MAQYYKERNYGAAILVAGIVLALIAVFYVFPPWLVATDSPEKAQHIGVTQFPLALWFAGAGILGLVIAYGVMRTRNRTSAGKQLTEQTTKDLYRREERDRVRTGAE
jgi:hypothetical protein